MPDCRLEPGFICPVDADESDEALLDRLDDLTDSLDPVPASFLADASRLFAARGRSPRSPSGVGRPVPAAAGWGIRAPSQL